MGTGYTILAFPQGPAQTLWQGPEPDEAGSNILGLSPSLGLNFLKCKMEIT